MTTLNIDQLTEVYLKMRDKKNALLDEIKSIESQMDLLDTALISHMRDINVKTMGTAHATVVRKLRSRFYSNDWPAFRQWARNNDAVDLFEARLHQGNTEEWLEKNPDKIPPGLQSDTKETVTVTRK